MSEGVVAGLKEKRGGYFHCDRRTWAAVCNLENLNAATAYLVLANGTGAGNDVSRWSAKSLETWTGMRRPQGRAAIRCLLEHGLLNLGAEHTDAKPRYHLMPWKETMPGRSGGSKKKASTAASEGEAADLIWIPNTLITGVGYGPSPVRALRMADDLWSLRLLVDLYHVHFLQSDGGVLRQHIWQEYERKRFGQQGSCYLWGFKETQRTLKWTGPLAPHQHRKKSTADSLSPVWDSIGRLQAMGLLSFIPHVFTNDNPEMEPLHSVGERRQFAEVEEIAMRDAGVMAAQAMLQPGQITQADTEGFDLLLPMPKWYEKVQVVGLVRLRFRPQTSSTSKWYGALVKTSADWVRRYTEMATQAQTASPALREWEAWGT